MSILSAMDKSHSGGPARLLARVERRKTLRGKTRLIGVEGMGRAFTRWRGALKVRRRDEFATAVNLCQPLLHRLQHECATRDAAAAL
jgi:Mg-chelatase subunit ChlI